MKIAEIILSYPCMKYNVEVSHFTARKSTAIEWVILEAINKCTSMQQYAGISIASFFEQIFTITDADLLIRPCLIDLQDMGAITISDIDDETELSTVAMSNLKLTKTGQEMQKQGLLPGTTAEDTFMIYYDIIIEDLLEGSSIYKDTPTGLEVLNIESEEEIDFPIAKVRNWLIGRQKEKKKNYMNWLTSTTRIEDISPISSVLLWKNVSRKIDIGEGLVWKVDGNEDISIDEASLAKSELDCPEEYAAFPYTSIQNPDKEIEKIVPIDELNALIKDNLLKDDLFCVCAKYYVDTPAEQINKNKKIRIGIIYGTDEFSVENKNRQILIRIPENDLFQTGVYFNATKIIQIGKFHVRAGVEEKDIALAFIPMESPVKLADILVGIVEKYAEQDYSLLFVLSELGLREMFLAYVVKIVSGVDSVQEKADIVEDINNRGIRYYNRKLISAADSERLLIDDSYIIDKCRTIEGAKEVLSEYGGINIFRQNEVLFQRILKLVLENTGSLNKLEDVWGLWLEIQKIKKSYLHWISRSGLYKNVYSKESIYEILIRFEDDKIFEMEEYTLVEQILLNMKRISVRVQEMLPEINVFDTYSEEKYAEVVLGHVDELNDLYDEVRKWRDEEERLTSKVINIEELKVSNSAFYNTADTMRKIADALAVFFDDSFIKYSKVYIVDTCTLMNEPAMISWFDDGKALLVIPMVVLEELDGLKTDEDEAKAYSAREVNRYIQNYRSYEWLNTGESSYPELLSKDLDPERNDNRILSIAIKYSAKKPVLLTDDINLGNIAAANNIETMDLRDYRSMKEHERLNSGKKGGKKNKKKRK